MSRFHVIGGKCGCPSILCAGTIEHEPNSRQAWLGRQNKRGHGYGRGKRSRKGK